MPPAHTSLKMPRSSRTREVRRVSASSASNSSRYGAGTRSRTRPPPRAEGRCRSGPLPSSSAAAAAAPLPRAPRACRDRRRRGCRAGGSRRCSGTQRRRPDLTVQPTQAHQGLAWVVVGDQQCARLRIGRERGDEPIELGRRSGLTRRGAARERDDPRRVDAAPFGYVGDEVADRAERGAVNVWCWTIIRR